MSKPLKARPDGYVNITVDPEAVALLDEYAKRMSKTLGFTLSRSQALRYLLKQQK